MSKKFTAARRNAFLNALAQTGSRQLAAERARVSLSWVQLHRSTDLAFDEACREAIAVAKAMLADDRSSRPADARWRYFDGHELVVNSTGGRGARPCGGRRVQVRRANAGQWTPRLEDRFLALLMATCNVSAACAELGLRTRSAYYRRRRWPDFARRWEEAIEIGRCELELRIQENIFYHFDRELPEPEAPLTGITVSEAIRMARLYEKRAAERLKKEKSVTE
ncbi:MAG TPA: hypothetical protein VNA29_04600 [Sphingomicrobium sp.]|nr:hypothetical protein [Sphingomicrobium sp.]